MVKHMLALQLPTKRFNNLHQQVQLHLLFQQEQLLFMCWLLGVVVVGVAVAVVEQVEWLNILVIL
jgi:hypothetical protein